MADARTEILAAIRSALADVPASERAAGVPVAREYRQSDDRRADELVDLFARRVDDYRAQVQRVSADELGEAITRACSEQGLHALAVAPGLPAAWLPTGVELVRDEGPSAAAGLSAGAGLSAAELDRIDGALTGCAAAIAETGTIVLDGGRLSGRRALTLVPDHHLCVVTAEQIHGQIAQALAAVATAVTDQHAPITLVSGPSASSDIELERVEGVHGPRHLTVLIVQDGRR